MAVSLNRLLTRERTDLISIFREGLVGYRVVITGGPCHVDLAIIYIVKDPF